jgi:hypothetical protein
MSICSGDNKNIENHRVEKKREIIYVDAGSINSENFRISLYHMNSNTIHIMELKNRKNNSEAEKYAIYYAIFYIKKYGYTNCMILSDNQSAVQDKIILSLLKELKIQLSWIPREINQTADENCKLPPTLANSEFNMLHLFIELSKKAYGDDCSEKNLNIERKNLQAEVEKLKTKIKNQATQINNLKNKMESVKGGV